MNRIFATSLLALTLAACGGGADAAIDETELEVATPPASGEAENGMEADATQASFTLEDAMEGSWRNPKEIARDEYRNPVETLEFFGIEGDDTVMEIWPGGGWYTNILAPWLHANGGTFIAAVISPERSERAAQALEAYQANYSPFPDLFGDLQYTYYDSASGPLGEPESVDAIVTFRNIHNWMGGDHTDKFFNDAFAVLKPGGVLGVVEHRLPSALNQDPSSPPGYVHQDYVTRLAEEAGFVLEEASEINANPADTADHPFGVWTLPPVSRTTDREGNTPEGFDAAKYQEIGESDRMTLRFVKPANGETPAEPEVMEDATEE
ncbi:MAG: methyltransferase domain-containing protein [Henriciella sp.]|nr:methyltransferase domain-containing protein [Henriciella sp.]